MEFDSLFQISPENLHYPAPKLDANDDADVVNDDDDVVAVGDVVDVDDAKATTSSRITADDGAEPGPSSRPTDYAKVFIFFSHTYTYSYIYIHIYIHIAI